MCLNATGLYGIGDKLYDQTASMITPRSYSPLPFWSTRLTGYFYRGGRIEVSSAGSLDFELRLL